MVLIQNIYYMQQNYTHGFFTSTYIKSNYFNTLSLEMDI
jgi:hypothetical protein